MEANELFIFRWSLLSFRTHGCYNLFIPPRGKCHYLSESEAVNGTCSGQKKKDSRAFNIQWMGDKFPITQRLWFVLFFCLFIFPGLSKRSLSWLYMCMSSDDLVLSIHDLFISLNAVDVLLITTDHCLLLFMWPWPADKSRAEGWEGCYRAGMVFSVTCWLCFWVMDGQ